MATTAAAEKITNILFTFISVELTSQVKRTVHTYTHTPDQDDSYCSFQSEIE